MEKLTVLAGLLERAAEALEDPNSLEDGERVDLIQELKDEAAELNKAGE